MIVPILDAAEKKERFNSRLDLNLSARLFYAHLQGLEHFAGKRVLEIGGTDADDGNTADYFRGMGAEYRIVRLEENKDNIPYVLPQRDFRDVPSSVQYDLIISWGVFEVAGLDQTADRKEDHRSFYQQNSKDLKKLYALTTEGGINIMGTISDPCLFSNEEIQQAGFTLVHRIAGFYKVAFQNLSKLDFEDSELVVMVR